MVTEKKLHTVGSNNQPKIEARSLLLKKCVKDEM